MAADNVKSLQITNLDATPILAATRGQGAACMTFQLDDYVAATATGLGTTGSWYKLCRMPTGAIIKKFVVSSDAALDTNSAPALAIDVNFIFSDSTTDGTPVGLQGLIPLNTAVGGTPTTITSYTTPNILMGSVLAAPAAVGGVVQKGYITPFDIADWAGYPAASYTRGGTNPFSYADRQLPLWDVFGFTLPSNSAVPADPGGFFDVFLYVSAAAATGAAGNILVNAEYVLG